MDFKIISNNNFFPFHFTTTKFCGNMKDTAERKKFCKSVDLDETKIVFANQVHGTLVKKVSEKDCGKFIDSCDGLITNDKNIYLCIFTADCMPIFLTSRDGSVVSLIHSGWRGLAEGIIESAVTSFLNDFGISPIDIFAYIGPHIKECCYQVGEDLKKTFNVNSDKEYFSLVKQAQKQMKKLKIAKVYTSSHCTCHEYDMFYSYRREKTNERMMSLIKIPTEVK
ncbi:MAG: peptidoglycan editing factor PgeF [Elusimicrobia bacterium]|nr:peptidoglycan editing factor PgeF [Elusimicrobiota bacterium]